MNQRRPFITVDTWNAMKHGRGKPVSPL